jgi:hypothetical protein
MKAAGTTHHGAPIAVFDRGRIAEKWEPTRAFLNGTTPSNTPVLIQRTESDRRPRGRDITGILLGDPAPGRSAQDRLNAQKT